MPHDPRFEVHENARVRPADSEGSTVEVARDLVLVVEDDPAIRMLVAGWLEDVGYRTRTAVHAEQAVEEWRSPVPAVVVSDVVMPGHNGFWLVNCLRQRSPHTSFIMMTGSPHLAMGPGTAEAGAEELLVKPFGRSVLLAAVTRAVQAQRFREMSGGRGPVSAAGR